MDTAETETATLMPPAASDRTGWKTEEYNGKKIHVCAEARIPENVALAGHGAQWRFTVQITGPESAPTDAPAAIATSDPALFYSTQAIAEEMGFLRGRELIEGT